MYASQLRRDRHDVSLRHSEVEKVGANSRHFAPPARLLPVRKTGSNPSTLTALAKICSETNWEAGLGTYWRWEDPILAKGDPLKALCSLSSGLSSYSMSRRGDHDMASKKADLSSDGRSQAAPLAQDRFTLYSRTNLP